MSDYGSTTQRGYGADHQRARRKWKPFVESGEAECAEVICLHPTRNLDPDQPWDLAHDRANPGHYLGPAHARCNRAEGGRRGRRGIVRAIAL